MPQFIYVMKGLGKVHQPDHVVLKDIWLSFLPGAKIGVLGLNGAGKSTLLRIMAGLIGADQGNVRYRGQPLYGTARGISMVFQSFALFPWLTVQQNVELGLEARGVERAETRV